MIGLYRAKGQKDKKVNVGKVLGVSLTIYINIASNLLQLFRGVGVKNPPCILYDDFGKNKSDYSPSKFMRIKAPMKIG